MDNREKEVQELCRQVLSSGIIWECWSNSYDRYKCVFCGQDVNDHSQKEDDIIHKPECAFLIAKDLSTNIRNNS